MIFPAGSGEEVLCTIEFEAILGNHRKSSEIIGNRGTSPEITEIAENHRGITGNHRKSLEIVGTRRKSPDTTGNRWKPLEIVGNHWKLLEMTGHGEAVFVKKRK